MVVDPKYWPAVFYGPDGQDQVFNHPTEVPEGWHDHPAKVGDPDAVTVIKGLEEALAAEDLEDNEDDEDEDEEEDTIPSIDDLTVAEIKALLDERNISYEAGALKADLYALLAGE